MSQQWVRSTVDTLCGNCNAQIRIGDPVLELSLAGTLYAKGVAETVITTKTKKRRCGNCAGGAPPELPPLVTRERLGEPFKPLRIVAGSLPIDWKLKQAKD